MGQPRLFIFYGAVLATDGSKLNVGGIQTYLMCLADIAKQMDWDAVIVQVGDEDFESEANGTKVLGRKVSNPNSQHVYKSLFERVKDQIDPKQDVLVWGTFYFADKITGYRTVAIQHGISFDVIRDSAPMVRAGFGSLFKMLQRRKAYKRFANAERRVCVDYNFVNWYRTFSLRKDDNEIEVIPNFTEIPDQPIEDKAEFTKILFARRFIQERGVLLMLEAAQQILGQYPKASITFAGEGERMSDVQALQKQFPERVEITRYAHHESISFHQQFDISVVPTVGSEGTSLSLLEAMAAGCAVICTNVGGMTNIVIDRFNGRMINPSASQLAKVIQELMDHPEVTNEMRHIARATAEKGFSKALWTERWQALLKTIS